MKTVLPKTAAGYLLVLALASPAQAGDRLTVDQLVARSEAAIVVEVRRGQGKEPETLALREVVAGSMTKDGPLPAGWLNWCVPSRLYLRRWISQHATWPARPLWARALAAPRFEALVFLRTVRDEVQPSCETESMLMEHTSLHPGYAGHVARVKAAWGRRPP
jgi:hypothetical protein